MDAALGDPAGTPKAITPPIYLTPEAPHWDPYTAAMESSAKGNARQTDQPLFPQILAGLAQPRTLSELSMALDVTDRRLAWHLQAMASEGLVEQTSDGRWQVTAKGAELASCLVVVTQGPWGSGAYDFDQAYAEARAGLYGDYYVQRAGHHASRLSESQANEFANRLQALVAEYFAPGQGDRSGTKYGMSWAVTPVDLHPLNDE